MTDYIDTQRCDIWLFRSRLFKTRSLAAKSIQSGLIRVERDRQVQRVLKPKFELKRYDRLIFIKNEMLLNIYVVDFGKRRGPARDAQRLYIQKCE